MSKENIENPKTAEETTPAPPPPEEPAEENAQKPAQTEEAPAAEAPPAEAPPAEAPPGEAPPEEAKKVQPEETTQESVEKTEEKPPPPADEEPKVEERVEETKEVKEESKEEPAQEAEQAEDESKEVSEEPTGVGEKEAGEDGEEGETDMKSVNEEAETGEEMDEITSMVEGPDEMPSLFLSSEMVVEDSNESFSTDEEENLSTKYLPKVKAALGSTIDIRKSAQESVDKRMAKYANTYQLDSNNPFRAEQINKILKSVMDEAFNNLIYDPEKCIRMAKWASVTIKTKAKLMEFDRYKIISYVSIGEKKSQDMLITCRSFWDIDRDKFCCYSTENNDVYGIALCFGLYYE